MALVDLVFSNDGNNLIELYNEIDQDCFYNGVVYKILYLNNRELTDQQNEVYTKMSKDYKIISISDMDINEFSGTVNILNLELE